MEVVWIILFSLMFSFAVIGNLLVFGAVIAHRPARTTTDYFLLNLSCADLTLVILNGVPNFSYMITTNWSFGDSLCTVNNFVANLTVSSCVFTMTALAIDRWNVVMRPFHPQMTNKSANFVSLAIWISSAILAFPVGFFSQTMTYSNFTVCIVIWPDNETPDKSFYDFSYNVFFLLITFVIPMVAIGVAYGTMSCRLWGQTFIGEPTQTQRNALRSKKRTVRMLILTVASFPFCWIPYHGYFIWVYLDGSLIFWSWARPVFLSFYFLAMSTSVINPFMYYATNSQFRECIWSAASNLVCISLQNDPVSNCHLSQLKENSRGFESKVHTLSANVVTRLE